MKSHLKALVKPALASFASHFGQHSRSSGTAKLWVLMYHRILPDTDSRFQQEEPGMLVKPETFEMHVKELKKEFELMFLSEWVNAKLKGEKLPEKACAITFDDGWLDNFEYALPILKAESTPATLFAVANKIGTEFQFWPNIISALLLKGAGVKLSSHPLFQDMENQLKQVAPAPNRDEIAKIISGLKQFSDEAIFTALNDLEWQTFCGELPPALMSWEQLTTMENSGLVEIGSHTCSHKRLTNALSPAELTEEIAASKNILQEKLTKPIDLFCFPNGDFNPEALSLVKATYNAAVTTRRGINEAATANLHELTRIGLHDEVSHTRTLFRARLSGWM